MSSSKPKTCLRKHGTQSRRPVSSAYPPRSEGPRCGRAAWELESRGHVTGAPHGPVSRASNRMSAYIPFCHPRASGGPGKPRRGWIGNPSRLLRKSGRERAVSAVCAKVRRPGQESSGREAGSHIRLRNIRGRMSRLHWASLDMTRGGGRSVRHDRPRKNFSESLSEALMSFNRQVRQRRGMSAARRVEAARPAH
jgi:hypothetical protein